jgi:HAD superfamily hydrolase (TIGR01484 family)
MSNVKLVVTDIDSTLLAELAQGATPAVHEAMRAVQAEGIHVAAATARPYEMAHDLFMRLGFSGPSVFDGGASIRDVVTGELLWHNWLDVKRLQAIIEVVLPYADLIDFFPGSRIEPAANMMISDIVEPAPYVWFSLSPDILPEAVAQLEKVGGLNIHPMKGDPEKSESMSLQITDKGSDKFHGVEALRKLLDVTREQTLAIGDGSNDIPLFKAADVKIAMGNAIPELKALADYEVATVEEDGWAEAMRLFVLS